MYVCDEANLETHGFKPIGNLTHDTGWENTYVSRITRLVQRDRNHACVIFWSLGNESGRGRNLWKARKELLKIDSSRPVCYEGGGALFEGSGLTELTDIVCPMYWDVSIYLFALNNSNTSHNLTQQPFFLSCRLPEWLDIQRLRMKTARSSYANTATPWETVTEI